MISRNVLGLRLEISFFESWPSLNFCFSFNFSSPLSLPTFLSVETPLTMSPLPSRSLHPIRWIQRLTPLKGRATPIFPKKNPHSGQRERILSQTPSPSKSKPGLLFFSLSLSLSLCIYHSLKSQAVNENPKTNWIRPAPVNRRCGATNLQGLSFFLSPSQKREVVILFFLSSSFFFGK